jgi:hypothetical protein
MRSRNRKRSEEATLSDLANHARNVLWWIVPLVVLAIVVGWEVDFGSALRKRPPPEEALAPKPVNVDLLPNYAIEGGLAARSETVNRTLFNPTRRPAPVAIAEASKPKMQRGQYALTGTTVSGERSLAFLKETSGGKARTVRKGDSINGMLVAEVSADRVKLSMGGETEELVLRVVTNPKPTPQPAPPPAQGAAAAPGAPAAAPCAARAAANATAAPDADGAAATSPDAGGAAPRRARAAEAAANAAGQNPSESAAGAAAAAGQPDPAWQQMDERYRRRGQGAGK